MRSTLDGAQGSRWTLIRTKPGLYAGAAVAGTAAIAGFVAGRRAGYRSAIRLDSVDHGDRPRSGGEADDGLSPRAVERQSFRLLYGVRRPVSLEELADALGSTLDVVQPLVGDLEKRGHLVRDGDDQVLGAAGLSVIPTPHVFVTNAGPRWTWCAWDALGIGLLLSKGTVVRSHCPQTGTPIEVRFRGRRIASTPRNAVLLMPERSASCVTVEDWCPLVNLMADADKARDYMKAHGISARIVQVSDAAYDSARSYRPLLRPLPSGS
jgi:Alkylmercury lyase